MERIQEKPQTQFQKHSDYESIFALNSWAAE